MFLPLQFFSRLTLYWSLGGQCVAALAKQIMEALPEERPLADDRDENSPQAGKVLLHF